ncbi:cyclic GMP-AMP synthase DncV-like nucleotidyltransferase [Pedobacter frigoris]|uniref:cyclic GMP-AMP synthase DncV-like nucleotidyltransferase n=1 Tax=Pedobacter frigoris TaxID=2571272 RepID=UPI00293150E5|nr:hypothetical protein [Pedobacter frigoris]
MANCNKLFLDYSKVITPSLVEMQKMKTSRESLEKKITDKIKEKLNVTVSFFTQGSGAKRMKTIIIKENGTYDADRGVYLPAEPEVSAETVQKYIYDAVKDQTSGGASHRKKCVRVYYKGAYNIDFPVYYEVPDESYSYIAVKGNGWIKDDPEEMINWFEGYKDEGGQLIRMVKYLKAWASTRNFKMPSGIALSVWAAKNFTENADRDDKCLLSLLNAIQLAVLFSVTCYAPVEPYDDLISKLSDEQRDKFKTELDAFAADAQKAVDETNQLAASKLWRKHLGTRFNLGLDEDVDKRASALAASAAIVLNQNAHLDRSGKINLSSGVGHVIHRNYGG